ncbi:MAG: ArsR/SmtB family transcription factor [Pyrobaculum sp.]
MIDEVLGKPTRIRILMALWQYGELNLTALAKRLRANYSELKNHIQELARYGIVEEIRFGRSRIVKLKKEEHIVKLVQALMEAEKALTTLIKTENTENNLKKGSYFFLPRSL